VSLTHGGIQLATGRQRYAPLFCNPEIDLTLVVPDSWRDYRKTIRPDPPLPGTNILIEKIRLHRFPKVEWYLHYYPRLGTIIRELQPDVIHLWEEPWAIVSAQAAIIRNRYTPHAALLLETDQNILRKLPPPFQQLRKWLLRETDLLIGRCDEALDVSRACGYDGPTAIVEYGIDRTNFTAEGKPQARKDFGVDDNTFTLGYVGRLVPYKGLDDVIDAMVRCRNRRIVLHVLGEGPDKERFVARFKGLGLTDQVKMFDAIPPKEVARFMKSLDALVLMSRTTRTWKEQFGRVIMEAHACGVPVIGSDSGSIPSVIHNGGWVVRESDSVELSKLLDRLASNPDMVLAAGRAGLRQADTRFNFEVVANALLTAYTNGAKHRQQKMDLLKHRGR
jgi:glycosyltransferase involved in cell wall biosynthesis